MQSVTTNDAHKELNELVILAMLLFVHCDMLMKSDETCRVTSTS